MSEFQICNSDSTFWPKWFSINNYTSLLDLTVEQFFAEIEHRLDLYYAPQLSNKMKLTDDRAKSSIESGQPLVASHLIQNKSTRQTTYATSLNLLDIHTLSAVGEELHQQGVEVAETYLIPYRCGQHLVLALDISEADNRTLLNDTEYLINQRRRLDNIPEPVSDDQRKANEKTLKKFISYKLVPYLDLQLYSYNHKHIAMSEWRPLRFTQGAYITLLYEGRISDDVFKNTRHKFIRNNLFDEEQRERLFSNVRRDKELLSRKMSAL